MTGPVLTLADLCVDFPMPRGVIHAVKSLNLEIAARRKTGLIGESGSGKTTTALAIMRMLAVPGVITGGDMRLGHDRTDILALSDEGMRATRLARVSYIPQGAMNSLNPVMRISQQICDGIVAHQGRRARAELQQRADAALRGVGLAADVGQLYPHELSGGMKQRVCIALAMILRPELIIADEPTSALDVVTQRHVMQTLTRIQSEIGCGLILVGHDMGLMAQSVDELAVMKDGELVEHGPTRRIIETPQHPYTRALIASVPRIGGPSFAGISAGAASVCTTGPAGKGPGQMPLVECANISKVYGSVTALRPLSFSLDGAAAKIISVVGQSGSGKSTLGSLMLGFDRPSSGKVLYRGRDIARQSPAGQLDFRKNVQAVFQDPYACFNPFYRVEHALKYPFKRFGLARSASHLQGTMEAACNAVGLDPGAILRRYPHQLSGGQRQRLIVARALMLSPRLLIADEPVSMVDASRRSEILKNIYDLKLQHGISVLYITHDLATAWHMSDYVIVLYRGAVVEAGLPGEVIGDPLHPYTQLLVNSIPWPDMDRSWGPADAPDEKTADAPDGEAGAGGATPLEALCDHPAVFRSGIDGLTLSATP